MAGYPACPGYAGRFLRVDLSTGALTDERWDPAALRKWVGGTGAGIKILYDEVPPQVPWDHPDNRLIMATGPLGGTSVMGTGTVSFVTRGSMTGGATSTQANGFMGSYIKRSGFDGVVIQGRSDKWVYLYLHDGVAELRNAEHLLGVDTYELQEKITEELGKKERQLSMLGIGPAGEHLVRFAAIAGDKGHVAGHNGSGAVMGSKRLKAIVAERSGRFSVADEKLLKERAEAIRQDLLANPASRLTYEWGTSLSFQNANRGGWLPVKNYTTNVFPEADKFAGPAYRPAFNAKRAPCWACQTTHLHTLTIPNGPYAGFKGEEPEYEQWAAWGSVIGNTDIAGAMILANEVDRLGLENNESGWVIAWAMESYERGILTGEELGGLEMTWGNVEATRALLRKIAHRDGIGDLLAEGVKRASEKLGRGSEEIAIYTGKGNTPRDHDHRGRWVELVDTCVSDTSTFTVGPSWNPEEQGAKARLDSFDWREIGERLGKCNGRVIFEDCVGICRFCAQTSLAQLATAVAAATGWEDFTGREALAVGRRAANMLRLFNLRCGLTPEMERPSKRYGSTPVDGPVAGKSIAPYLDSIRELYYQLMGWDIASGRPLPETLAALGLGELVPRVWPES